MVDFKIDSNIKQFQRAVKHHKRQIPYATSVAVNETLKGARPYVIARIRRRQKSKKAWWSSKQYGIRRTFAKKNKLIASIFTKIWWGHVQEHGGRKVPHHGKHVVVPSDRAPAYSRKSGGLTRLLQGKKVFANEKGVFRRVGGRKSRKIERLHTFKASTPVRPMLHFKSTVGNYVRRHFPKNHRKAMVNAIKTARR